MSLYPSPPASTLAYIPSGEAGTARTLDLMVRLVKQWRRDPGIWKLARDILHGTPANARSEIDRFFHWVKRHIRYTQDVRDVETLATPKATLEVHAGDCDDMAILLATLLESTNHPTRFVALAFSQEPFSHVITQTRLGSGWISLDPTVAKATVGWQPPNVARVLIRHV